MKLFLAILLLTLPLQAKQSVRFAPPKVAPEAPLAAVPTVTPPVALPGTPMAPQRTVQEDAELRDWIEGMMKENAAGKAETLTLKADLVKADTNIISVQTSLVSTQTDLIGSQKEIIQLGKDIAALKAWGIEQQLRADAAEKERDEARKERDKAKALAERFAWIIGIEAFAIVLFLCLWLRLPSLAPPWGLVATCTLPVLALGIIKLLPHL